MRAAITCALVLAMPGVGHAQTAAESDTEGGFMLPALQLSASSDDQGKLKASIPYKLPIDSIEQFVVAARLQTATAKGVSTLFSSSGTETLPWEAGATLLVIEPEDLDVVQANRQAEVFKMAAYDACAYECSLNPKPANTKCELFKTNATPIEKIKFDKANLCPDGHDHYLVAEARIGGLRSIPAGRLSVGFAIGRQQFKYLNGPFGAGDSLATASSIETTVRTGALYTRAWALTGTHAGVIDIRALYSRMFNAASGTGHWCQPEGMVGSDPNSSVQQCKDLPLGAPTQVATFTLAADFGIAESFKQTWRGSLGAFTTIGINKTADSFGIEVPVYLNFTPGSAFKDYVGSYKGILRVTPRLSWSRDASNHFPTTVVLTVEALAQDSIFSEVLDY